MIWVIAVVVVGLIVVLAELLLHYQKMSHDLRTKQDPYRRRIRLHNQAMQEAASRIQSVAEAQLADYEHDIDTITRSVDELAHRLRAHEKRIFGDGYDPYKGKSSQQVEAELVPQEGQPTPLEKDPAEVLAAKARDKQGEAEGHRTSLVRDIEVTKRTLGLLEGKLRRGPGGLPGGPDQG
ncbi:MAG: hypothetical protein ABIL09_02775 [Gemmatimonadota bacterium]